MCNKNSINFNNITSETLWVSFHRQEWGSERLNELLSFTESAGGRAGFQMEVSDSLDLSFMVTSRSRDGWRMQSRVQGCMKQRAKEGSQLSRCRLWWRPYIHTAISLYISLAVHAIWPLLLAKDAGKCSILVGHVASLSETKVLLVRQIWKGNWGSVEARSKSSQHVPFFGWLEAVYMDE